MDAIEFWTVCSGNGIVLDRKQTECFERFHRELLIWNKQVNLISRQDMENIYERHFLHSLSILKYFQPPAKARCLDVGTGGGFPGIPLKIARTDIGMLLVDSIAKKVKLAGMFAQHTGLRGIEAKTRRAESLVDMPEYRATFDVISARAVAPLVQIVSWVEPLLKPGATMAFLKGGDLCQELSEATKKFPKLQIVEHQLEINGAAWFKEQEKKLLLCTMSP